MNNTQSIKHVLLVKHLLVQIHLGNAWIEGLALRLYECIDLFYFHVTCAHQIHLVNAWIEGLTLRLYECIDLFYFHVTCARQIHLMYNILWSEAKENRNDGISTQEEQIHIDRRHNQVIKAVIPPGVCTVRNLH